MNTGQLATLDCLNSLLEAGVDHAMLINEMGRIESMVSKNEIRLSNKMQEVFSMGFRLHLKLLQEIDDTLGPVEKFVICRQSAKKLTVPHESRILVFIMNIMEDHTLAVRKAKGIRIVDSSMRELDQMCTATIPNG